MRLILIAGLAIAVAMGTMGTARGEDAKAPAANPVVVLKTTMGVIKIELWPDKAPITVKNFLTYTEEKFFDGTIFDRVAPGATVQAGQYTAKARKNSTHEAIKNEATAENKNVRGTICMTSHAGQPDTATAHWLINVRDNPKMDHKDETPTGFGNCVFGKVIEGMDVVDKISNVKSDDKTKKPEEAVVIETITVEKK